MDWLSQRLMLACSSLLLNISLKGLLLQNQYFLIFRKGQMISWSFEIAQFDLADLDSLIEELGLTYLSGDLKGLPEW